MSRRNTTPIALKPIPSFTSSLFSFFFHFLFSYHPVCSLRSCIFHILSAAQHRKVSIAFLSFASSILFLSMHLDNHFKSPKRNIQNLNSLNISKCVLDLGNRKFSHFPFYESNVNIYCKLSLNLNGIVKDTFNFVSKLSTLRIFRLIGPL